MLLHLLLSAGGTFCSPFFVSPATGLFCFTVSACLLIIRRRFEIVSVFETNLEKTSPTLLAAFGLFNLLFVVPDIYYYLRGIFEKVTVCGK